MKITTVSWDESFKERLKDPEYAYKLIYLLTKESDELERRLKRACEYLRTKANYGTFKEMAEFEAVASELEAPMEEK